MVSETFTQAMREERERRRWSQAELARRVTDLGHPLDNSRLSRLESGQVKKVTLDDAIAIAAALDVPPLSLLMPAYPEDVELAPKLHLPRGFAVGWMKGQIPLSREGVDSYRAAARDIRDAPSVSHLVALEGRSPSFDRAREMLEAMAERERRDLHDFEEAAAARPEFFHATESTIEKARRRIQELEHLLERWPTKEDEK
jgi:transcriptional regulator with XRE-family HTH domain